MSFPGIRTNPSVSRLCLTCVILGPIEISLSFLVLRKILWICISMASKLRIILKIKVTKKILNIFWLEQLAVQMSLLLD